MQSQPAAALRCARLIRRAHTAEGFASVLGLPRHNVYYAADENHFGDQILRDVACVRPASTRDGMMPGRSRKKSIKGEASSTQNILRKSKQL